MNYTPEGSGTSRRAAFFTVSDVRAAIAAGEIYEGVVTRCDGAHQLWVSLGGMTGVIPRIEGAVGIAEGTLRDIALLSRVGRPVCFCVIGIHTNEDGSITPVLSRRAVQERCQKEFLDTLIPGDIIPARVTRTERFGAFIDVGCGLCALIPIDMLSVSRIAHPAERLRAGERIHTVLKSRENGKLTFSLKELLGTWEENAARFAPGDTVMGIVRSVESYGAFVELAPNLAGLTDPSPLLTAGERVSVLIRSVNPAKMKVKLSVVECLGRASAPPPLPYFIRSGHLSRWDYAPPAAGKKIITLF